MTAEDQRISCGAWGMKLKTGIRDGKLMVDDCLIDHQNIEWFQALQVSHDAAYTHALIKAMDIIPKRVVFHTITNRECIEQLLDAIKGTADEIMRKWGFEP